MTDSTREAGLQERPFPDPQYRLGDEVWKLQVHNRRRERVCDVCEGSGRVAVTGTDKKAYCPEGCSLGKLYEDDPTKYWEIVPLTIGKVSVEQYANKVEIEYMAHQTGVGSGTIHKEDDLFVTVADAETEAQKRGAQESWKPVRTEAMERVSW